MNEENVALGNEPTDYSLQLVINCVNYLATGVRP
jgi:hypothetical protein